MTVIRDDSTPGRKPIYDVTMKQVVFDLSGTHNEYVTQIANAASLPKSATVRKIIEYAIESSSSVFSQYPANDKRLRTERITLRVSLPQREYLMKLGEDSLVGNMRVFLAYFMSDGMPREVGTNATKVAAVGARSDDKQLTVQAELSMKAFVVTHADSLGVKIAKFVRMLIVYSMETDAMPLVEQSAKDDTIKRVCYKLTLEQKEFLKTVGGNATKGLRLLLALCMSGQLEPDLQGE